MDMAGSSTRLDGFELLADTLGEMVSRHDAEGRYLYASAGTRGLTGYEPEELIGRSGYEFIHPGDLDDLRSAHAALVEGNDRVEIRYRHRRKDDSYAECEAVVRAVRDPEGEIEELVVVKRDAGGVVGGDVLRRQWEICFKRTSRGITVTDGRTGTIISLNPALAEMHGGTVGDFVGKPLRTLFTDKSWETIPDVRRTIDKNTFVSYDSDHVRLDGTTFPVRTEVMAASDERGDAHYRIAWYDDLSERQAAERRAVFAERDFEAAFHASPHGVAIVGLDGRFLLVNQKLADIVGYPKEQLVDLTFQEITHPDDLDADLAQVGGVGAGEIDSYEMEKRYYTREGRLIWVLLAAAIVRDEDGVPRPFISQIQDISTRKRLEAHTYELANRDAITSLYNRRRFEEELRRQITRCREDGESAALLLLDLDRFKDVNDSAGHVAGDRLIPMVGRGADEGGRGPATG